MARLGLAWRGGGGRVMPAVLGVRESRRSESDAAALGE